MLSRLLRFILGWLEKTPTQPEARAQPVNQESTEKYDLFMPEERLIYHYWNGQDIVAMDPLVLYKKMQQVGPELSIDMVVAHSASKDANTAHTGLVVKIRNIFNVKNLGEGGLSEFETVQLLDHFLIYCESLKKNMSSYATSPMVTSSHSVPSTAARQPTTSSVGSGSTESVPSTGEPVPLPTA